MIQIKKWIMLESKLPYLCSDSTKVSVFLSPHISIGNYAMNFLSVSASLETNGDNDLVIYFLQGKSLPCCPTVVALFLPAVNIP